MLARKPDLQLRKFPVTWSRTPEFALMLNGSSITIPYVEHFLNNVINEVRAKHCEDDPELKRDLDMFIKQETNHSRFHIEFNKALEEAGFTGLQPLIDQCIADHKRFRSKWSLAFNIAYCAGFENTATFTSKYLFERCDHLFRDAHPGGANLFLWHVAEEFEHRTVCHRAFAKVSGNYFIRVAGLVFSFFHIGKIFDEGAELLLAQHRKDMTEEQKRASVRTRKALVRRQMIYLLPRMALLLIPYFNPGWVRMGKRTQRALEYFRRETAFEEMFELA